MASHSAQNSSTHCELDTHADTCAFGWNLFIVYETSQAVSVAGYPDMKEIQNVCIVTAAVAYDCRITFTTLLCLVLPTVVTFPKNADLPGPASRIRNYR